MNFNSEITHTIYKKTLGLAFALSAGSLAFAQNEIRETINITGKVSTATLGVPYASITFNNLTYKEKAMSDAVLTNDKGEFSLSISPGKYKVTIQAIDFKPFSQEVDIVFGKNTYNFTLEKEENSTLNTTQNIKEVVLVAGSKPYKIELDKKVYDPSQDLMSKGGNLQDVLTNIPSVDVEVDGTVSMRGNSNVQFLINGKPSALLGIDSGASALQSIPADQIERIEVITNPSSRFEASGSAGILNIILKKSKSRGFNGSVEGALGYLPMTRLNTNLNWKRGSVLWYLSGGGSRGQRTNLRKNNTQYFNDLRETTSTLAQSSNNKTEMDSYNINAGVNIDLTEKTSLGVSGLLRYNLNHSNDTVFYNENIFTSNTINNIIRYSLGNGNNLSAQGDIDFDHKFNKKGHQISGAFSIQQNKKIDGNNITEYENSIFQSKNSVSQNVLNKTLLGKLDYQLPIGEKSSLELGYRFDKNDNTYDYVTLESLNNVDFYTRPEFTSVTTYNEMFNSFYGQFKSKINRIGYQIGLRAEMSKIDVSFQDLNANITSVNKNYTNFFPSVFLSYDLGNDKNNQILLNYSKRIRRPRGFFLIPFNSFNLNDDRNIFKGNPDLNPEYMHSFELGYAIQKRKYTINPTIYYRYGTDEMQMVVLRNLSNPNILETKPYNIGNEIKTGLDLSFSGDLFPWWKVMGNADVFYYKTTGSFFDSQRMTRAQSYDGEGFSFRGRLTNTFKIGKTFNFQIQTMMRGSERTESDYQKANYHFNLAMSKTLWKGNGTLSFNIQDIFDTRGFNKYSYATNFERYGEMKWEPRTFVLSLSYRFKQGDKIDKNKEKKTRETMGGEEQIPM